MANRLEGRRGSNAEIVREMLDNVGIALACAFGKIVIEQHAYGAHQ